MVEENVEHVVIAALRAEGRHGTVAAAGSWTAGQLGNRVATADSRTHI